MKYFFTYCFVFIALSFSCSAQSSLYNCMLFHIEISDTNAKPINGAVVKNADLACLQYSLSYYNFGDVAMIYQSPAISQSAYFYDQYFYGPLFIRVYLNTDSGYIFTDYWRIVDIGGYNGSTNVLLPKTEVSQSGEFKYLQFLQPGEYEVYFDYVGPFDVKSTNSNNDDPTMVSKCFCRGIPCYLYDGYYFQTSSKNKIHFTVVK